MPEALISSKEDGYLQGAKLLDLPTQEVLGHSFYNAFKEVRDSD